MTTHARAYVLRYADSQEWATGEYSIPPQVISRLPLNEWSEIQMEGGKVRLEIMRLI